MKTEKEIHPYENYEKDNLIELCLRFENEINIQSFMIDFLINKLIDAKKEIQELENKS